MKKLPFGNPLASIKEAVMFVASFAIAYVITLALPPIAAQGVMAADNVLLTIAMITREALRVLENNLTFTKRVNRQFDDRFGVEGAKIGTVLNVRVPPRYIGRTGQDLQIEDAVETQVPVALTTQAGVDLAFTSQDLTLSIDDFSQRFIVPAIASIANRIDNDGLALYKTVGNTVGTINVVPSDLLTYLQAGVQLDDASAPMDGQRSMVITPLMQATLVNALKGLFQQAAAIADQYIKGQMGTTAGFDFFMDQNCRTHTVGALGGTPLVNAAGQTGSSIVTDGWTASITGVLKQGDSITFAGVYATNYQSRESTGSLRQFAVTADVDSDSGGNATIPIFPPLTPNPSAQSTVTVSPADNAIILIFGSASAYAGVASRQGLAFHQDAFTFVSADLPLPRGVDMAARVSDKQLGISIRMIRAYDITKDRFPTRLDILYGWAALRPELACRVLS